MGSNKRESGHVPQQRSPPTKRAFEIAGSPVCVSQVSDEIGIWMNSIMKDATAMCHSDGLSPQHRETLGVICSNMSRIQRAKNDLMDCLLVEANELTLQPASYAFRGYMIPMFNELASVAAAKGITIAFEIDSCVPEYLIYEAPRLHQVLFNVTANAIARTAKGEAKVTVKKPSQESSHGPIELEFSISNSNLLEEKQSGPTPFQSYRKINNSSLERWTDATGTTQAITRQLIRLMGGRTWTSCEAAHSSMIHFTITAATPSLTPMISNISKFKESRILIVDDEDDSDDETLKDMLGDFPLDTLVLKLEDLLSTQANPYPHKLQPNAPFEAIIVNSVKLLRKLGTITLPNSAPLILLDSRETLDLTSVFGLEESSYYISSRTKTDLAYSIHKAFDSVPLPVNCRVLAAEPDRMNRLLLSRMLDSFYTGDCTVCEDGRQAFEYVTRQKYDIILMKFAGPGTHGEEAAVNIRAYERKKRMPHTPLIALAPRSFIASGLAIPEIFDGYVETPIWKRDLSRTMISWIRKSRLCENYENE
ncbi:hypothetical protein LOZ53_005619 [Ophidiomyces ophidiicola]|uniref:uncharacterized protein n=1 Tax=Ophidiomyces ophidiicola TaxID=1387563 RepID=UPI0020C55415|nr:uncharacterized protein LOZ57_002529 [Ophidiomyces ophidiicola]KAI1915117.1 hypothetical protein LOZ61_001792 [Ophidiomyces ophidiicola]KAI1929949.1 hypothetical protein LOZ60_001206 [Ophidiomyces ophidiicola]KAI1949161.1 hypothetical protein LOZ57_002529 [Ophidiomyces ophidiicola]KAI1979757.1 hypothetical protein LOZ54_006008 [Ophidiomyces ophidiicola]KAI1984018.1 hypothetical protein LOZ53_005619 [Ophidiomyces ophidiicola]